MFTNRRSPVYSCVQRLTYTNGSQQLKPFHSVAALLITSFHMLTASHAFPEQDDWVKVQIGVLFILYRCLYILHCQSALLWKWLFESYVDLSKWYIKCPTIFVLSYLTVCKAKPRSMSSSISKSCRSCTSRKVHSLLLCWFPFFYSPMNCSLYWAEE
jgi:hypothetical protein